MKTILVPTDLSNNALNALKYALKLAEAGSSRLIVFHCSNQSPAILMEATTPSARELMVKDDIKTKKIALSKHVEKALKLTASDIQPRLIVESNPFVVENVLEVAQRSKVSLIVMGTHGASGMEKVLFGSNTTELISKSEIPVLAIPEKYRFKEVKKILFATDLADFPNELKKVIPFSKATGAAVNVLYMDYGPHITGDKLVNAMKFSSRKGYENVKIILKPATIEVPLFNQLSDAIATLKPGWVVMFTKERSFWDKIFRKSKTEKLAYELKYPLLSFRKNG